MYNHIMNAVIEFTLSLIITVIESMDLFIKIDFCLFQKFKKNPLFVLRKIRLYIEKKKRFSKTMKLKN